MNLFANFFQFLSKPFPKSEDWLGLSKNFVSISIGTTLFLYLFQPSGISQAESIFLVCLGFGIAGALGYLLYELGFDQLIKRVPIKWTYGKWLIYSIGVLLFIALANFLFVRYLVFGYMDWQFFPAMIRGVFMFGIPALLIMLGFFYREENKYHAIAEGINRQQKRTVQSEKQDEVKIFDIPIHQIRYVEALQNYVTIAHVDDAQKLKKQTERATLKSILETTKERPIIRTHRSFLVNRQAITETTGNSQGLLLTLSNCDKKIPVSRSYVVNFK